jgi:hypothetical protein
MLPVYIPVFVGIPLRHFLLRRPYSIYKGRETGSAREDAPAPWGQRISRFLVTQEA